MLNYKSFILILTFIISFTSALPSIDITTPDTQIITILQGNLTNFTQMGDTPSSYAGQGGNCTIVNAGETGLEFGNCATGVGDPNQSISYNTGTNEITLDGGGGTIDISEVDTNETERFNNSIADDCIAGEVAIGVQINGTFLCRVETGGGGGLNTSQEYIINDSTTISFNETLAGTNLSVNDSDFWDGFDSVNTTVFEEQTGGILGISFAWLESFINAFGFLTSNIHNQDLNTTSNVTFDNMNLTGDLNATNIYGGNFYFGNTSGTFDETCPDRPLVSNADRDISVCSSGCDYITIQEAVCQIPLINRFKTKIDVGVGTYLEDVFIPPVITSGLHPTEGAISRVQIIGSQVTPLNVKVNSFTISSGSGTLEPTLAGFSMLSHSPQSDENASIYVYGTQQAGISDITFEEVSSTTLIGIEVYSSGVSVHNIDLGVDKLKWFVETKHNGYLFVNSDSTNRAPNGSVTDVLYQMSGGGLSTIINNDENATGNGIRLNTDSIKKGIVNSIVNPLRGLIYFSDDKILYGVDKINDKNVGGYFDDRVSADGLIAYYNGESLVDYSGNGAILSPNNINFRNSNYGRGFDFDGSTSWLSLNSTKSINESQNFSIFLRWYGDSGVVNSELYEGLAANGGFRIQYDNRNGGGNIELFFGNGTSSAQRLDSRTRLLPGAWHDVGVSYNQDTQEIRMVINGYLDGNVTVIGGLIDNPSSLTILGSFINKDAEFFDGSMDEIYFYNRTLSDDELKSISFSSREMFDNNAFILKNSNASIGQLITFAFEETIDNIVDGWIRVNGNLNVTGNITARNITGDFIFGDGSQLTNLPSGSESDPFWSANLTAHNDTWNLDTNETARFDNLTAVDCAGDDKVVGVQDNGTILCGTDQTGAGGGISKNTSGIWLYNDTTTIFFNETLAGTNLSVNDSDNWDGLDTFNTTTLEEQVGGILGVIWGVFRDELNDTFNFPQTTYNGNQVVYNALIRLGVGMNANTNPIYGVTQLNTSEIWATDNINTTENVTAKFYFGDGSNLLNLPTGASIHDQDLNTTSDVIFNSVNVTGGNFSVNDTFFFVDISSGSVSVGGGASTDDDTDTFDVHGTMKLEHTAIESDDHALEIDVNASGFGDVKGLDIVYTTGDISPGEDDEVILVNIDQFLATGGDVIGLEVVSTTGSAKVIGLEVGALVNPIEQLSGTFGDMDSALNVSTDVLSSFISTALDVTIFESDDSNVTIGNAEKFEEIEFILDTVASGAGIKPTFEYSTGIGAWGTFTPTDATNGLRNNGIILWLDSDIPSWNTGINSEYLIRITRTANNLVTDPIEDIVQISSAIEYSWNKDGDLNVNNITSNNITANFIIGGNISLEFGDLISEQNPDAVDAIRIKAINDIDMVLGSVTSYFSIWNSADDTAVFYVDNTGDTDILGTLTLIGSLLGGGSGHDQFSDFVADEHIDVTNITFLTLAGTGLLNEERRLSAGTGLEGVDGGGGSTFTLNTKDNEIDHDALLNYISGEHIIRDQDLNTTSNVTFENIEITNNATITNNFSVGGDLFFVDVDSGKVGIGTDTPANKLEVVGAMRISGNMNFLDNSEFKLGNSNDMIFKHSGGQNQIILLSNLLFSGSWLNASEGISVVGQVNHTIEGVQRVLGGGTIEIDNSSGYYLIR
ncbi:hypothetical protein LCGC14_0439520 [marine sediment metagenome]|uniref:LamG-like jellyroll fold domain-containing protein n=1 Tax=marine sediment metagenome TaxID=412755 RepID=A0A0F9SRV4_9ZZZZ